MRLCQPAARQILSAQKTITEFVEAAQVGRRTNTTDKVWGSVQLNMFLYAVSTFPA